MSIRPCLNCGELTDRPTRCARCAAARNAERHRARRGRYGGEHQRLRAQWSAFFKGGGVIECARGCGVMLDAATGFDLDHLPDGTSKPSCKLCNRSADHPSMKTDEG